MASTVLSGTGNVTYTNSTGQNVRVVINYMAGPGFDNISTGAWTMSWAGVSIQLVRGFTIGRNLAFAKTVSDLAGGFATGAGANNAYIGIDGAAPTEIMLSTGQTFATAVVNPKNSLGAYNIVIIPEAG